MTKLRLLFVVASLLAASPMLSATQPTRTTTRPLAKAVASKPKHAPRHRIAYTWCDSHMCREKPRLVGKASFYGKGHWQGKRMANGQRFDYRKPSVALWFLPLGTMARITNLENGKSIVVEVTDRGPAHSLHRIADLSEAAAEALGYADKGLAWVLVQPVADVEPELPALVRSFEEPRLVAQTAPDSLVMRVF